MELYHKIQKNAKLIMSGYSLSNKLKMVAITFLRLVRKIVISAHLKHKIEQIESLLWSKIIVKAFFGYKFALVDRESYVIVSREFEDFMLTWFAPRNRKSLLI